MATYTGVDLSKILGGQTKILGRKVIKSDKCMGVSQSLGACAQAARSKSTPMAAFISLPFSILTYPCELLHVEAWYSVSP